jgi:hypothetical protein
MKFATIIATRGRPRQAAAVIEVMRTLSSGQHPLAFIVACDDDDSGTRSFFESYGGDVIVSCEPRPPGVTSCWNRCVPLVDADVYLALPDDTFCATPNWDVVATEVIEKISLAPGVAALAWHDTANPGQPTIIMATREWINLAGLFDTRYPFWFADTAVGEIWSFVTGRGLPIASTLVMASKAGKFNPRLRDMDLWWDLFAATRKERLAVADTIRNTLGITTPPERIDAAKAAWEARDVLGRASSHQIVAAIPNPAPVSPEYLAAKAAAEAYLNAR